MAAIDDPTSPFTVISNGFSADIFSREEVSGLYPRYCIACGKYLKQSGSTVSSVGFDTLEDSIDYSLRYGLMGIDGMKETLDRFLHK